MVGDAHRLLSRHGARFLLRNGCELIATEFNTAMNRCCDEEHVFDAIGLDLRASAVRVVEAKTSRADFRDDPKIWDARRGYAAVAEKCWLICPEGLISVE